MCPLLFPVVLEDVKENARKKGKVWNRKLENSIVVYIQELMFAWY